MHAIQKQFHDFINDQQLIDKSDKVLLAISGGVDSMVMANLFLKDGIEFGIAHCNYGLRGEESDGDEQFVLQWAGDHAVECFSKRVDLGSSSVQLGARNARYQWFDELIEFGQYTKVATAHHLNDSVETCLLNLSRGTGIRGLTGISAHSNKIIRPLLFATKDQITRYANEVGLEWREDSSNMKLDYDRNHIRHQLIPTFEKLNPSLISTFERTLERLKFTSKFLEEAVKEVKAKNLLMEQGFIKLNLAWLREPEHSLILSEILNAYGFNYSSSKEVASSKGSPGKKFYSNAWELSMDRDALFLKPRNQEVTEELVVKNHGTFSFHQLTFRIERVSNQEINYKGQNVAFLDADKAQLPLTVRAWRAGDRFQPLGMRGSKKVSDFLIDEKVPLALKNRVYVLESNGKIVWLIGYRISDEFKLADTKKVLKVELID